MTRPINAFPPLQLPHSLSSGKLFILEIVGLRNLTFRLGMEGTDTRYLGNLSLVAWVLWDKQVALHG